MPVVLKLCCLLPCRPISLTFLSPSLARSSICLKVLLPPHPPLFSVISLSCFSLPLCLPPLHGSGPNMWDFLFLQTELFTFQQPSLCLYLLYSTRTQISSIMWLPASWGGSTDNGVYTELGRIALLVKPQRYISDPPFVSLTSSHLPTESISKVSVRTNHTGLTAWVSQTPFLVPTHSRLPPPTVHSTGPSILQATQDTHLSRHFLLKAEVHPDNLPKCFLISMQ